MPPKAAKDDVSLPSQRSMLKRKRKRSDSAADAEEGAAPKKRWFLVKGYPHLGISLRLNNTYSEDSLRARCNMDKNKLKKLEIVMKDPEIFQRVDDPTKPPAAESKDSGTADAPLLDPTPDLQKGDRKRNATSTRSQPASRVSAPAPERPALRSMPATVLATAPTPGPRRSPRLSYLHAENPAPPSHVAPNTTKGKVDPGSRNPIPGSRIPDPGSRIPDVKEVDKADDQPVKKWFILKAHPNLGMGLRIDKKYSEDDLIERCADDKALLRKLRKMLVNPEFFEETTVPEEKERDATRRERNSKSKSLEVGQVVWSIIGFDGSRAPWPGVIASRGEDMYGVCPFLGEEAPEKEGERILADVGDAQWVPSTQVIPWPKNSNAEVLSQAIFLAGQYHNSTKRIQPRRRLTTKCQPA